MENWSFELSTQWDVLGPFPIHAREQHYLAPSFPLDLTTPYNHEPGRKWPSAYADGGEIGWSKLNATQDKLLVSFPHIRWSTLRATEGWAALQHHNVLRTTLKVIPPITGSSGVQTPRLAVSLLRGSFFTLIPEQPADPNSSFTPEWHPGNIYALPQAPKQLVDPPSLSSTEPTSYHLFISGDYEIRLFGDPLVAGRQEPVLDIGLSITLEPRHAAVVLDPSLDITCDFVDGWAFGDALGVGIRATDEWWDVLDVAVSTSDADVPFSFSPLHKQRLAPAQTRIVPVQFLQMQPFRGGAIPLAITLVNSADSSHLILTTSLKIRQRLLWNAGKYEALKVTYFLAGTPTLFRALPPLKSNLTSPKPPIIALHGAGVDISDVFWPAALPRQSHSWVICPAGRTSWGFDWHGPSADDAWGSLASLTHILASKAQWVPWAMRNDTRVIVIGHSNGGQGTWYLAARYPDRVLAAIPAAAYIKSQQYLPLSLSRGSHFMDPSLRGILDASLAPEDNDLFLSNVVDVNILAIHGGNDENVPTWHSRELVGLVKSWRDGANISFAEDPGKSHWYSDVLTSSRVRNFLSSVLQETTVSSTWSQSFTLTVATPEDSGSFHGFTIREVVIPGRLGKLHVSKTGRSATVRTTNVHTFSVDFSQWWDLSIDGMQISLDNLRGSTVWIQRIGDSWTVCSDPPPVRRMGALSQILRSPSPLVVIVPAKDQHAHSIATRLAHAMLLYFRIDTEIVTDSEALTKGDVYFSEGDVVIVGLNNEYGKEVLRYGPTLVQSYQNGFTLRGKKFDGASFGLLFLHPHPSASGRSALFLCGTDTNGLERATRLLLPVRTGVTLPEFVIIESRADSFGTGGLRGAGFWDRNWGWNQAMSWLD